MCLPNRRYAKVLPNLIGMPSDQSFYKPKGTLAQSSTFLSVPYLWWSQTGLARELASYLTCVGLALSQARNEESKRNVA